MPKKARKPAPPPPPPGTVSLRLLVKASGRPLEQIRSALRKGRVQACDGSAHLYKQSRVKVEEAEKALIAAGIATDPDRAAQQPAAPAVFDPARLAADAATAASSIPLPAPAAFTPGGGLDDPVPAYLLEGALPERVHGFPMPTHPDPDYYFWAININPNRQYAMRLRGWRFVDDLEYAMKIRPDGLYRSMRQSTGRIRFNDLELARLPKSIHLRYREERNRLAVERAASRRETLAANIDDQKRNLRRKLGPGGDKHIAYYEGNLDEAEERAAHTVASRRGESTRTTVDLGSRPR